VAAAPHFFHGFCRYPREPLGAREGTVKRGESETLSYHVDGQNRIAQVGPNWDAFALANDAPEVCARKVLNRPLMDFLSGFETKHLYDIMLSKVRSTRNPLTVPFRCDAPDLRRFMELTMRPREGGGIEFQTVVLREEARTPTILLDRTSRRGGGPVLMCAWCKKVNVQGEWLEVEDAVAKLQLFQEPVVPELTHGICSSCRAQVETEMAR
jgi:hypothetical protein